MAKSFKDALNDNPAMAFISKPEEQVKQRDSKEKTRKAAPSKPGGKGGRGSSKSRVRQTLEREKYSRHVQLLMQPSTYRQVKEEAEQIGVSLNSLVNEILKEWLEG